MSDDGSVPREVSSHDDGELSDESIHEKMVGERDQKSCSSGSLSASPVKEKKKKHKHKKERGESEEDRLRRRLLEKRERETREGPSGDDEEMFTIQPVDSQKSRLVDKDRERDREKERREREREKDRERQSSKHKHSDRRERDRHSHDDRHRAKYEDRRLGKSITHRGSSGRDHREKRTRSEKRERQEKERRIKRSLSPSSSPEERERKRERRNSDGKNRKKDKEIKDDHQLRIEGSTTELLSDSAAEFVPYKNEDTVEENVITSFTLDSPAGPKKYSKFDSSPEGGEEDLTPVHSDVGYSDVDEEPDEIDFDPQEVIYEQLTDEQKALLSPETKKRLEDEWQKRLISQLPVFYPGIMGCRNVAEFDCVNRVEEGTFGVVYRAKDKRTDEIVALKRLKMEKEKEGFPITALREINMLLKAGHHKNIVNVREILIGSNMDKIYLAMEFVEHDMKSLMDTMQKRGKRFTIGEQKTLMMQLLSGLEHMHGLWILHRDLKTSNLLMSHKGILKIADFGLAREYGDPLKPYTAVVVTLWYRSPELLLGQKIYSTPIDLWSVGCIMAEFMLLKPLFPGSGEIDQINKIFIELGTPSEKIWEGYNELPGPKTMTFAEYPYNQLRKKFPAAMINETGFKLLNKFLTYDPERRITAAEALKHPWFTEDPQPTPSEMFPTFPAKSEQHKAPPKIEKPSEKKVEVVNPEKAKLFADLNVRPEQMTSGTFALKFDRAPF